MTDEPASFDEFFDLERDRLFRGMCLSWACSAR